MLNTPKPPYFAVIFSSKRTEEAVDYLETNKQLLALARKESGFIGVESVRNDLGITISYWKDLESINRWRDNLQHKIAKERGIKEWYESYHVRIAEVKWDKKFENPDLE